MNKSIEIKNLNFSYGLGGGILKNVNLSVDQGEFIVIVGGNGSGKSTLLKNMLGELKPRTGSIKVLGKNIEDYTSYKEIGYVPQISIVEAIAFPTTVREMVLLNLYEDMGPIKIPGKEEKEKVDNILKYMGLIEYKDYPVNELSGGLQQRSMIARAMVNNPKLLILDEPTAGVDQENRAEFLTTIQRLNDDKELTVVLVTHELQEVLESNHIDYLYEIMEGELLERPVNGQC